MKRKIISIISVVIISLIAVSCKNSEVPPVITDLLTDPVTDTFTEPVTEPITEPITELITEPVTEPVTEPITEPVTEPITELVTDPITEPVTTDSEVTEAPTETAFDRFKAMAVRPQTVPQTPFEVDSAVKHLTVQEQDTLLRDLLYKGADGFVHIKGAESIRLPIDGEYSALPAVRWGEAYLKTPEIFVYHKLNTTVVDSSIPAYHAGGTNGINEVVENNGVYGFSFSKSFVPFPDDVIALFNDATARVTIENWYMEGDRGCAVIHASKLAENRYSKISVILTTTDGGESINVAVCDTNFSSDHSTACTGISFVSDTEGYLVFERMYWSMGRVYHVIMKTSDGGKTFVFLEDENNGYTDMGKNSVFLNSNNYVNVGYFYNGIPKDLIRRGTVGVDAEAIKTSYYIPDENEWLPDNSVDCREYPILAVLDGYTPYFDGDIGVIAFKVTETSYSQAVGLTGYVYYVSLNRGYTWSLYTGFENDVVGAKTSIDPKNANISEPFYVRDDGNVGIRGTDIIMPTTGYYFHAWENDPYMGPEMIKDRGVSFVSRGLNRIHPKNESVSNAGRLVFSEHLWYGLSVEGGLGSWSVYMYLPDGTKKIVDHSVVGFSILPIDKKENTIRFVYSKHIKYPAGSTVYSNRNYLYTVVLSNDGREVLSCTGISIPGYLLYMDGDIGLVQELLYSDPDFGDFYRYYATRDGGKTWVDYLPPADNAAITTVKRLLPYSK